jgi:hypothetical protein
MNSKKLFFVLIGLLIVVSGVGIAAVVFGDSYLHKKSEKLVSLKAEAVVMQNQQDNLVQAKRDVEKYSDLEKIAKTIVPQEKDQARTVRELIQIANESGVGIATVSFPSSTLGQSSSTSSSPSKTSGGSQLKPVDGISGLYQMEVTVQSDTTPIPYARLLTFLSKLEQNRRTAQVSSLTVQPATTDRSKVSFTLILNVYIKP